MLLFPMRHRRVERIENILNLLSAGNGKAAPVFLVIVEHLLGADIHVHHILAGAYPKVLPFRGTQYPFALLRRSCTFRFADPAHTTDMGISLTFKYGLIYNIKPICNFRNRWLEAAVTKERPSGSCEPATTRAFSPEHSATASESHADAGLYAFSSLAPASTSRSDTPITRVPGEAAPVWQLQ